MPMEGDAKGSTVISFLVFLLENFFGGMQLVWLECLTMDRFWLLCSPVGGLASYSLTLERLAWL